MKALHHIIGSKVKRKQWKPPGPPKAGHHREVPVVWTVEAQSQPV